MMCTQDLANSLQRTRDVGRLEVTPHPSLPGARTLLAKHTQQPPSNAVTWGRLLRDSVAQWVTPSVPPTACHWLTTRV